jgi:hypothetical protein
MNCIDDANLIIPFMVQFVDHYHSALLPNDSYEGGRRAALKSDHFLSEHFADFASCNNK